MNKKSIISIGIVFIVLLSVLSSGCIGNKNERSDYLNSNYQLYLISTNLSSFQIDIRIPFPTQTLEFGDREDSDEITINNENSPHGMTIHMNIRSGDTYNDEGYYVFWRYEQPITEGSFSTQNTNEIWINFNHSNHGEIYFSLWKEDMWDTEDILYTQTDYSGVMKNPFPTEIGSHNEYRTIIKSNTIELNEGWHTYPLTNGTFLQYVD